MQRYACSNENETSPPQINPILTLITNNFAKKKCQRLHLKCLDIIFRIEIKHCSITKKEYTLGSTERRQREREEMQEVILQTALKLFITQGYENVTIRKIAQEIEYTPGAIYSYFEEKDQIFWALHQKGFELLWQQTSAALKSNNPKELLICMGEEYIKFALDNPELYDLMFLTSVVAGIIEQDHIWAQGDRSFDALVGLVNQCVVDGYIEETDPTILAYGLWSFVHGLVSLVIKKRAVIVEISEKVLVEKNNVVLSKNNNPLCVSPEDQRNLIFQSYYVFIKNMFIK